MKKLGLAVVGLALAVTVPAIMPAQATSDFKTVPVSFTGLVIDAVGSGVTIQIPQAQAPSGQPGVFLPYTGPTGNFQPKAGDQVQVSFNLKVPTTDFLSGASYQGPVSADGVYRLPVLNTASARSGGVTVPGTYAEYGDGSVLGPYFDAGSPKDTPPIDGMEVVYDTGTDRYRLTFPAKDTLTGDPVDYALEIVPANEPAPAVGPQAMPTSPVSDPVAAVQPIPQPSPLVMPSTAPTTVATQSTPAPSPVPVPAPGVLLIFAAAAAAVFSRRQVPATA